MFLKRLSNQRNRDYLKVIQIISFLASIITLASQSAECATCTWTGASALWNVAGNWSGGVPGVADTALFNSGNKPCNLNISPAITAIQFTPTYSGAFGFGAFTLSLSGNADFSTGGTVTATTGALSFTGTAPQTFIPKAGATFPGIIQNGTGGTTIIGASLTAGVLTIDQGTFDLGTSLTNSFTGVTSGAPNTGTLNFDASTLQIRLGNADFHLMNVIAGTGLLSFTSAAAQSFTPHTGFVFPPIVRNGTAGATTVLTYPLHCPSLTITQGIFSLGAALLDTVDGVVTGSGTGSLTFSTATLIALGDTVNLGAIGTITPTTGTLKFARSSGATQVLVPNAAGRFNTCNFAYRHRHIALVNEQSERCQFCPECRGT